MKTLSRLVLVIALVAGMLGCGVQPPPLAPTPAAAIGQGQSIPRSVNLPDGHGGTGHDDSNTINTVSGLNPQTGISASAATQLYNFMTKEDANRWAEQGFPNFVASGCQASTQAGLTDTPTACTAYNAGYRGVESGSVTLPNNNTCWLAMDENTSGLNGSLPNFTRQGSTHYLTDCIDVTQPTMASDSQLLAKYTTSGGAITAVVDYRRFSAIPYTAQPGGVANIFAGYGVTCDGVTDTTTQFQAVANTVGAAAIYVPSRLPTGAPNPGCVIGLVSIPNTIFRIFGDGVGSKLIQKAAGTRMLYTNKTTGLEIDHLQFVGVSVTTFLSSNAPICIDDVPNPASPNCGSTDNSANVTIGDNANIYIHDNYFLNMGYATTVQGAKGLRFENNTCDTDGSCLQAIDTNTGWISHNTVLGTSSTTFASMLAVQNTGKPLPSPDQHNRGMHILANRIRDVTFGQDILVHDCIECEIVGNVSTNSRMLLTVSPAFNFNQILTDISVVGNVANGATTGNATVVGNYGINVGGDFAASGGPNPVSGALPVNIWIASHNYSQGDMITATTAATDDAQNTRFVANANCASGNAEPTWNTTLNATTTDNAGGGTCVWTSYGLWTATNVTVSGNTVSHTGYIDNAVEGGIHLTGSTSNVSIVSNTLRDNSAVGIDIRYTNRRLNISSNNIADVVVGVSSTQRDIFIDNSNSNPIVDGNISNNYLADGAPCIFDRVTSGGTANSKQLIIFGNTFHACGTTVDVGNTPAAADSAVTAFTGTLVPHTFITFAQTPYAPDNKDDFLPCDATAGDTVVTMPAATTTFLNRRFIVVKVDTSANKCIPTVTGTDRFFSPGGFTTTRVLGNFGQGETYVSTSAIEGTAGWIITASGLGANAMFGPSIYFSAAGTAIPAAGNSDIRQIACVSDETSACTPGNTYASGGANKCQVQSDGTNWKVNGTKCF